MERAGERERGELRGEARGECRGEGLKRLGSGWKAGGQDLVLVVQAVGVQLLVAEGAAPQGVAGGARAPPGRRGRVVLPQTCTHIKVPQKLWTDSYRKNRSHKATIGGYYKRLLQEATIGGYYKRLLLEATVGEGYYRRVALESVWRVGGYILSSCMRARIWTSVTSLSL